MFNKPQVAARAVWVSKPTETCITCVVAAPETSSASACEHGARHNSALFSGHPPRGAKSAQEETKC